MSKLLITALLVLLVTACANAPSVQFYVLEPLSQIAPITVLDTRQHTIGIGPISVPALLERKQIITRHAGNAVEISEFQQWASPLQDNLLQALRRNISSLQPNDIVRAYPWSVHGTVDLQIVVDIIRFDTTPGKSANFEANWTIKNENTHEILKAGHSVINHSLSDSSYSGAVLALSKVLGEFSQELSLALLNVEMSN